MPASARQGLLALFALCLLVTFSLSASANSVSVHALGYLGQDTDGVGAKARFFLRIQLPPAGRAISALAWSVFPCL